MLHNVSFFYEDTRENLKVADMAPPSQRLITSGPCVQVGSSLLSERSLQWGQFPSSPQSPTQVVSQPSSLFSSIQQPLQSSAIAIIDDSTTICIILETCLQREGFLVKSFGDGIEAMRWFFQPGIVPPALIILDIGLPKMDGYEVARRFKARPEFCETVIIMLTRRDGSLDRLKGQLAGAKDYLTKPFTTSQIVSVVETHLRRLPAHVQRPNLEAGQCLMGQ